MPKKYDISIAGSTYSYIVPNKVLTNHIFPRVLIKAKLADHHFPEKNLNGEMDRRTV